MEIAASFGPRLMGFWNTISPFLGRNDVQLLFIVSGAFFCFFPLWIGLPSHMEDFPLRGSLTSPLFRESSFAMLGAALPLSFDAMIGVFFGRKQRKDRSRHENKNEVEAEAGFGSMNCHERIVLASAAVVAPAIALLPASSPNLALAYVCASRAQLLLGGGTIMLTSYRGDRGKTFSLPATLFVLVTVWVANVLQPWAINLSSVPADASTARQISTGKTLRVVTTIVNVISALVFVACGAVWLHKHFFRGFLVNMLDRWWRRVVQSEQALHAELLVLFPAWYILASFIVVAFVGYSAVISNFNYLQPKDVLLLNMPFFLFIISEIVLSLQISKYEMAQSLYKLLDSKKTYVRYM